MSQGIDPNTQSFLEDLLHNMPQNTYLHWLDQTEYLRLLEKGYIPVHEPDRVSFGISNGVSPEKYITAVKRLADIANKHKPEIYNPPGASKETCARERRML
ncbi:MAG: hypothetical protein V1659_03165 [Candidatus Woesearchaeota archaeon]